MTAPLAKLELTVAVEVTEAAGWRIVIQVSALQPLVSVTVTQCNPPAKPVAVAVVWPLLHKKVIAPVPPEPIAVAVPSAPLKQVTLVWLVVTLTALGSVMVIIVTAVQLLESLAVTEYIPTQRPVAMAVVWPSLHI